jgi:DNA repair protein RadC
LGILLVGPHPVTAGVTCLLLDERHRGLTCLDVSGRGDAEAVSAVAELLVGAAEQEPDFAAVVIASSAPARTHHPQPEEVRTFAELLDVFDDAGIELIDWFVIAGGFATSLAEHTGVPWRWLEPPRS